MQVSHIRFIDNDGTILAAEQVDIPDGKWAISCPDMHVGNDTESSLDVLFRNGGFYFIGSFGGYWTGSELGMLGIGGGENPPGFDCAITAYCIKRDFRQENPADSWVDKGGEYLFVSDRPFGIVWPDLVGNYHDDLVIATQIQNGKLSGFSLIHIPDFGNLPTLPGTRETDHFSPRERIQLGRLAWLVSGNVGPADVLRYYSSFLWDNDLFLIECQLDSPDDLLTAWVPAYWATAIIYLSFFGHRPTERGSAEYTRWFCHR